MEDVCNEHVWLKNDVKEKEDSMYGNIILISSLYYYL